MIGLYFIVIFICLLLSYTLWQYFELKKFSVSKYEILSDKLVDCNLVEKFILKRSFMENGILIISLLTPE